MEFTGKEIDELPEELQEIAEAFGTDDKNEIIVEKKKALKDFHKKLTNQKLDSVSFSFSNQICNVPWIDILEAIKLEFNNSKIKNL